jgi:hypothetical protein
MVKMEKAMEGRAKFNRTSSPHSIQVTTCTLLMLTVDQVLLIVIFPMFSSIVSLIASILRYADTVFIRFNKNTSSMVRTKEMEESCGSIQFPLGSEFKIAVGSIGGNISSIVIAKR